MKKEIRMMLDYQCYPIWVYDENGRFIDNNIIEEMKDDESILTMLETLQDIYDGLFLNNEAEFKYIGFVSDKDKKKFEGMVNKVYTKLTDLLGERYIINNMINISEL